MTARRRHFARIYAPRRQRTDNRYGLHALDGDRLQYALQRQQVHRDAAADDPWLSPSKSAIVRECLIMIEYAASHAPLLEAPELSALDLRRICEDAELPAPIVEVMVMVGEGWTQREIGSWLGLSQTTVWRYWHHGRGRLAGWLPLVVVKALDLPESRVVLSR